MRFSFSSRLFHGAAAVALAAGLGLGAQSAYAEAAPAARADQGSSVGEVVVTAQFRRQNLQNTPIAITAVQAATLEARGQTNIVDLTNFAPNVNLSVSPGIQANAITAFIRGVGQQQGGFAFEPGVGIYIDDVYYGTTFGAVMDLTDLDRVEVLRGPQGTLAGKNSLGGAIKLYSKAPDGAGGGFLEGTYGSYQRMDLRGSADFTIADGLYARVSGVEEHRNGFMTELDYGCVNPSSGVPAARSSDNCVTGHEGGGDLIALRAALRYAPAGSPLEINLIVDGSRDNAELAPTKMLYGNNPAVRSYVAGNPFAGVPYDSRFITAPGSYTNYSSPNVGGNFTTLFGTPYQVTPDTFTDPFQNNVDAWGVSGTIDYKLADNLSLKSVTAYRKAWGTTVNDPDGSPLDLLKERLTNTHKQFTEELRLTGNVGKLADFTVGGFYYKANDLQQYRITIPIYLYDFLTDDPISNRSAAAFAHLEIHATDRLNFVGGIRYTNDEKTYTFHRLNVDGSQISGIPLTTNFLVAGLDGLSAAYKGDRVDYRLGANYRLNDALMVYAQVATGYKGGGVNPQPFVADQVVPFGPETLTSYEAGFKADLFDRMFRLNGAAFLSNYKNVQETVYYCPTSASTGCAQPVNAADVRTKGFELEGQLRPILGFTVDGSLAYLDSYYTKIIDPFSLITIGMTPPFASKWQASAGVEYAFDLEGKGRIIPRLDWSYLSSFYYQAVNSAYNHIPGRSLFNARLSYRSQNGEWMVSGSVTNLANKFYYVGAAEAIASFGDATGVVGHPREFAITVRRNF